MAYGQTGSGKTHTMFGDVTISGGEGVAFRLLRSTAAMLRSKVAESEDLRKSMSIEFSFLEVYNEKIYDLLGSDYQFHFSTGLQGVTRLRCGLDQMEQQVRNWICQGAGTRSVGETAFNPQSSRSHAVAMIYVNWNESHTSRICIVDLAGSERVGQYALSDVQLSEGCSINQGLSALGKVVAAMSNGKGEHVPFRDSVLTWLLKDVITGNGGRAFLFATVNAASPAETESTLRYALQYSGLKSETSSAISALGGEVRNLQVQVNIRKHELEEGVVLPELRKKLTRELQRFEELLANKQAELLEARRIESQPDRRGRERSSSLRRQRIVQSVNARDLQAPSPRRGQSVPSGARERSSSSRRPP
eukprot:gnl/MRDRNA2_/MRDRNA2_193978_c0_seq1.p1 gnl/MRDRNA2_/MRDRNA2_193978_c0~~gnl/MRDRNA2_/MRDRNA2_193978_c0_seq1.p1  ORF type:complete len:405 (+),score=58.82 gnl/MRDRNA2_/MRDRNA2_193978_c0_seq1:131-1216(+)